MGSRCFFGFPCFSEKPLYASYSLCFGVSYQLIDPYPFRGCTGFLAPLRGIFGGGLLFLFCGFRFFVCMAGYFGLGAVHSGVRYTFVLGTRLFYVHGGVRCLVLFGFWY